MDELILFFSRVSLSKFSLEALSLLFTFFGYKGIYSKVWDGMWKVSLQQNRVHWWLTSRLGWVGSSSRQLPDLAILYFFSCSDSASLTLQLSTCFACVFHFSESPLMSQSQVPVASHFLLHILDQIFALFHTQPLHYSHLNIGYLNAEIQANLARNKANTWLNKFNLTSFNVYQTYT